MRANRTLLPITALAAIALPMVGCTSPTEVSTGSLEVSTVSIGSAIDTDGYRVDLATEFRYAVGVNAVTTIPELRPARYWSPDGTRIAFMRYNVSDSSSDVYIMNADGSNQVNLTNTGQDGSPAWSPGP